MTHGNCHGRHPGWRAVYYLSHYHNKQLSRCRDRDYRQWCCRFLALAAAWLGAPDIAAAGDSWVVAATSAAVAACPSVRTHRQTIEAAAIGIAVTVAHCAPGAAQDTVERLNEIRLGEYPHPGKTRQRVIPGLRKARHCPASMGNRRSSLRGSGDMGVARAATAAHK
jgi:hypothetical protein